MKRSRRIPLVALLLSLGTLGLGQMYNGQLGKAVAFFLGWLLLTVVISVAGLFSTLYGMIISVALLLALFLFALLDALFGAIRAKEIQLRAYNRWYLYVLVILVTAFGLLPLIGNNLLPYHAYKVPSGAMEPTLQIGDHLIAHLGCYREKMPQRGDLVIFAYPGNPSVEYIKRVTCLEGDVLEIKDKALLVNGQPTDEPWVIHVDKQMREAPSPRDNFGPFIVPEDYIFVLGDNRDNSADSRFFGPVHRRHIKGKVLYVYWAKDKKRIGVKFE